MTYLLHESFSFGIPHDRKSCDRTRSEKFFSPLPLSKTLSLKVSVQLQGHIANVRCPAKSHTREEAELHRASDSQPLTAADFNTLPPTTCQPRNDANDTACRNRTTVGALLSGGSPSAAPHSALPMSRAFA